MAIQLCNDFETEQKKWAKLVMKGRPLYFGLQAKTAKAGKFLLSKKADKVKPKSVKELKAFCGGTQKEMEKLERKAETDKKAEKELQKLNKLLETKNKLPGSPSMGVAQGQNGTLRLRFKGSPDPSAAKFVKYFLKQEVGFKLVKKVIVEILPDGEELPAVPEDSDLDSPATTDSVNERAQSLSLKIQSLGNDAGGLANALTDCLTLSVTDPQKGDEQLDSIEFLLSEFERLSTLTTELDQLRSAEEIDQTVVEGTQSILDNVRTQLSQNDLINAAESLDAVEDAIEGLRAGGETSTGAQVQNQPEETVGNEQTSGGDFATQWPKAQQDWQNAIEKVDGQIAKLQQALKQSGDDDLEEIAELGLNAVTGNFKVPVMVVVRELGSISDPETRKRVAAKGIESVMGFAQHIGSDPRVAACDENPFGVSVGVRSTLVPALQGLKKAFEAAAK